MKNQTAKIDHINISVKNLNKSLQWYQKIFHFEVVENGSGPLGKKWSIIRNGDSMIALSEYPNRKMSTENNFYQIQHFGLRLQDREEWQNTIDKHQLKFNYDGEVLYPHSSSWYLKDPTGHEIEVVIWNGDQIQFS